MRLRLVDSGPAPGALNMGIDEAVLRAVAGGSSPPTLRLYSWSPACVTVGYFQSLEDEVDLEACRAAGVDAVRRITGGGAVFHEAEITYSIVLPEGHPLAPAGILESYELLCGGLVAGLGLLGVEAAFEPINDIRAGGRKVSGNAQTRKLGCLLQHGTVLLGLDLEKMFSLLKVPKEKLAGKLIAQAKERVTSLGSLLGREPGYAEAARALAAGFAAAYGPRGVELERGELRADELAEGRRIAAEKFSSEAWNRRR
ncbi:MAG TPA: biotin/lipoate A/B protein ligase family protein [Spirochaetales bacterium]|nr:biotin/lipoate A/B protein ligase family protein [Spirochaetales bacterium]HRY55998.1 biotin/lipoate A/B protein ligase family protein [Spirochaetia bacterium]HRZ65833.1 biotin/lipoate A/B protein ligase family protein [Spirochaetia bacterium]